MALTQPLSDLASHANALKVVRFDLLDILCEQKAVLLALEAERQKFILHTTHARVLACLLENEKLFQQLYLQKIDLFTDSKSKHRVIHHHHHLHHPHHHISHHKSGSQRSVVAHLEILSPLRRLDAGKHEGVDNSLHPMKDGMDVLVVPLNSEFEIECSLVLHDDGDNSDKLWKEQQKRCMDGIHSIPFILTYISGDASLSDESNTLAYAQCRRRNGTGIQIVRFSRISLHLAKASSHHVLLVTHPRTQYCVIQPLEVPILTLAPPVITIEELQYIDVKDKSIQMPAQISDMELRLRVSVKTDDNISCIVLTCHEQHRNGQKFYVGICEIRDEECKEYRIEDGHWCFHHQMPMRTSGTLDSDGRMVLLAEVTLSSMQHHVFKETFQVSPYRRRKPSFQRRALSAETLLPKEISMQKSFASSDIKKNWISGDSEKYRDTNNQEDAMGKSSSRFPPDVSTATSDVNIQNNSTGGNEDAVQVSTGKTNENKRNALLSSFILGDYGLLAVTSRNGNSVGHKIPHLVWFTHSTTNAIRSDTYVSIKGLHERMLQVTTNTCSSDSQLRDSEWRLEPCCDTSRKWLLQNPRGGSIVLSSNKNQTHSLESCCFCCFFPPALNSPTNEDVIAEQFFVEGLQYLVQRWTSGTILCTDSMGQSRVLVNDSVAISLWKPGDEEDTNLLVFAHRGRRFSVYSLSDQAVVLHSNLQATDDHIDIPDVKEYRGITPVLGGNSVVLWSSLAVELFSHAPTWTRRLLYKMEFKNTVVILALCSAQNISGVESDKNKSTSMVSFLLLSDGNILGLSLDGNTQLIGRLPSDESISSPSPSSSSSSSSYSLGILTVSHLTCLSKLTMRHVILNEKSAICVCGFSEDHILRRAYVS
ncbi:uncharacterized protein TM35_000113530 [Trypanosoma theileri]|uniref:Uncharacterized protein n=1 Tax=Trypanosoma theileri TaxID=67003 RepID=A0A1X0P019_9TRYP|nr:uncharacterized protein TM35_000113530 [Trypanosoma theileri]ORC89819.1 hypothetical protein TM35_000113530 [Trypanosoma theileri]